MQIGSVTGKAVPEHCENELSLNDAGEISRFRIRATALRDLLVPIFGASMIRGVIGHALRHLYCECDNGPHDGAHCLYSKLFETEAGNAFVITPPDPGTVRAGAAFEFHLTLLDASLQNIEAIMVALDLGLRRGLGPAQIPCSLSHVSRIQPEITPLNQHMTLQLTTHWYIKRRNAPLMAAELSIHNLLVAMAQRQRQLVKEGYLTAPIPENTTLLALADALTCHSDLSDIKAERRSNRQQVKHPLQGVTGCLDIEHPEVDGLAPLTGLVFRAEWLHGGGKASFGLGGLQVKVPPTYRSQIPELRRIK